MVSLKDTEKLKEAESLIWEIKRLQNLKSRDDLAEFPPGFSSNPNVGSFIDYRAIYLLENFYSYTGIKPNRGDYWVEKSLPLIKASCIRILKRHMQIGIDELTKQLEATGVQDWKSALK